MPQSETAVRPTQVVHKAVGQPIGRLLEIYCERDVVAEVVRGAQ